MSATELLSSQIRRKIPGAVVYVTYRSGSYDLVIQSKKFDGLSRADREAAVYNAIAAAPLELIAKITSIDCVT